MTYEVFRHFADSWGLVGMGGLFLLFTGWTFRKGAGSHHERAAQMIFRDDDNA